MKKKPSKNKIGIIGFGCVGQGLYDIIQANPDLGLEVAKICVKERDKQRSLPEAAFTYDPQELLQDASITILAELISDAEEAYKLVSQALKAGKTVVSANKKMVAEHLPELIQLQKEYGGKLLYEASVCGSIPIIRTLEAYYGAEALQEVSGILNGSSNYILSKLDTEGVSYAEALQQAQALGFAEADPSLDVEGFDAVNKLCIVASHAFGVLVHPEQVLRFGIQHISTDDVALAQAVGARIRLVATAATNAQGQLALQVVPTFVKPDYELYHVNAEFNGVNLVANFAGTQFLKGRGAGSHPTGSAVWADTTAALAGYSYTYAKLDQKAGRLQQEQVLTVYIRTRKALEHILWQQVEVVEGEETSYVGTLTQEELLKNQVYLNTAQAFVAHLPDGISKQDFTKALVAEGAELVG